MPRLLFGKTKTLSSIIGTLSKMPIKVTVLGLLNPVTSEKEKYLISKRGITKLIWEVTGGGTFYNTDHLWALWEEICDGQTDQEAANETKLKRLFHSLKCTYMHLILRAKSTGVWMIVRGTTVSGTVLSATDFGYFLCTCYNGSPLNI